MPDNEPELTPRAKQAIRSYVVFLIGIPAVAVAILMFLLGSFIKDVAQEKAFNEAFKTISGRYTDLVTRMVQQQEVATRANQAIETDRLKAEEIRKRLESVQVLATATSKVDEIATAIRANPDFKLDLVPKGTIAAFALTEPPDGWEVYEPARGRIIVGVGSTSGGPAYALEQTGGVDAHRLLPDIFVARTGSVGSGGSNYLAPNSSISSSFDGRPPFISLLVCRKK